MQLINRFKIFAIFNKIKEEPKIGEAQAKGHAIWLAKYNAGKRYGGGTKGGSSMKSSVSPKPTLPAITTPWKCLSGIPQTDETYDKEIVGKLGQDNYNLLENLIKEAYERGVNYKEMRDCPHGRGYCQQCSDHFEEEFRKRFLLNKTA